MDDGEVAQKDRWTMERRWGRRRCRRRRFFFNFLNFISRRRTAHGVRQRLAIVFAGRLSFVFVELFIEISSQVWLVRVPRKGHLGFLFFHPFLSECSFFFDWLVSFYIWFQSSFSLILIGCISTLTVVARFDCSSSCQGGHFCWTVLFSLMVLFFFRFQMEFSFILIGSSFMQPDCYW